MRKTSLSTLTAATSKSKARQVHRRIALNFIRLHNSISRAELARVSGLQRGTLSAIVDELIEEGWVAERLTVGSPNGSKAQLLHLDVERAGIFAVELRPEVTTVGLSGVDARYIEQTSWPTPQTPEAFVRRLARTVAAMRRAHPRVVCAGMGISLPGRIDHEGRLVFAPNLRWREVNLSPLIETACGLPVVLENAANACALGEFWFGSHQEGVRHLVAVTISEGVGVGLLIDGHLLHGGQAMAGEFGHVTLDEDGPPCPCGKRGCWERYASNSAAIQHYVHGPSSEVGDIPRFEDLLRFAAHGDGRAIQSLERMARYLGFGLANLAMALAPELIVVIGEVTAAWDRLGPIVLDAMQKQSLPHVTTRVVATDPATQPRLRGAVSLVVQRHFGTPHVC
jgi:predicted NBD/HSP70 family sugar kinase